MWSTLVPGRQKLSGSELVGRSWNSETLADAQRLCLPFLLRYVLLRSIVCLCKCRHFAASAVHPVLLCLSFGLGTAFPFNSIMRS